MNKIKILLRGGQTIYLTTNKDVQRVTDDLGKIIDQGSNWIIFTDPDDRKSRIRIEDISAIIPED